MLRPIKIGKDFLDDIANESELNWTFTIFMAVSGTLAAIAFLTNSVPLLIGAMVVAPVYTPLSLIAFAICAGDFRLSLKGFGTALVGIGVALFMAAAITALLNLTGVLSVTDNLVHKPLLEERVRPGWYSVAVGITAGIAGAVATIQNRKDVMVGVVAAVALIPAGSAGAVVLVSNGDVLRALGGIVLMFVNLGLIIATGIFVAVFMENKLSRTRHPMPMDPIEK